MWRSIGAKVPGAAHMTHGTPCQDAFRYAPLTPALTALAVADGAGSAPLSKQGAVIAVHRAVAYLTNIVDLLSVDLATWDPAIQCAFDAARGAIHDFASARGLDRQQFATTLQIALVGPHAYCYGRVGDGAGVGRVDGAFVSLGPAPDNAYVNETTFLTSARPEPDVVFDARALTDCALFTDGLQPVAMHLRDWQPHGPFFGPLFDFVRGQADVAAAEDRLGVYLAAGKFHARTDDDRALVISVWTGDD
jgi:hypothetical protein